MLHFSGEGAAGQLMYLAHSTDGLHWNDLNGGAPIPRSTIGTKGVRDPALVRSPGGDKYWIIATDLCIGCGQNWEAAVYNGSRDLVWESTDLVTWSQPWLLNVAGAIPDGRNAWAPEAMVGVIMLSPKNSDAPKMPSAASTAVVRRPRGEPVRRSRVISAMMPPSPSSSARIASST